MSRETLLARLRNALASRLARSRWGRHRSSEPAAPPVPIVVPVELPLPTAMETPPAHPPQIEILVPRAPGRFETDAELGMHPNRRLPIRYRRTQTAFPAADSVKVSPFPSLLASGFPALFHCLSRRSDSTPSLRDSRSRVAVETG
jgi:hypothetical protein